MKIHEIVDEEQVTRRLTKVVVQGRFGTDRVEKIFIETTAYRYNRCYRAGASRASTGNLGTHSKKG